MVVLVPPIQPMSFSLSLNGILEWKSIWEWILNTQEERWVEGDEGWDHADNMMDENALFFILMSKPDGIYFRIARFLMNYALVVNMDRFSLEGSWRPFLFWKI